MIQTFGKNNFQLLCDQVADRDPVLRAVIQTHGYPPMWTRPANFETLVHIILEQQVSLASALAALRKLKDKIGTVTPSKILALEESDLKACYFSRQKAAYVVHLAKMIRGHQLDLSHLPGLPDEEIRETLKSIKGIGDWTANIYLIMALQRTDVFPLGDLAMVNSFKKLKGLTGEASREALLQEASRWQPLRSLATMILWHYYLQQRRKPEKSPA